MESSGNCRKTPPLIDTPVDLIAFVHRQLTVVISHAYTLPNRGVALQSRARPPIRGKRGRPLFKPRIIQADRGYDHDKYRRPLHAQGIKTEIARRNTPHGSGLGKTRWVVERTIGWLHN